MRVTKCPACNSAKFIAIGEFKEQIILKGKNSEFIQESYSMHECLNCGLHYKSNILSPEQFSRYYNDSEFEKWGHTELFPPEEIIEKLLVSGKQKLQILDFGCSEGRLLGKLLDKHVCYGFDLNLKSLELARLKGIKTFSSLEELTNSAIRFDVIILIDVFEHLLNPIETISLLLKLLKGGGEIIISTGYANSWAYKKQPAEFWYSRFPEHVCMLSDKFVEYLCVNNNLKVNFKAISCHYKTPLIQKLTFYLVHYSYWNTIKLRKFKILHNIYPFKKIFKWITYPRFPVTKDHIIVALKNKQHK